jgi:hypothetical protein
MVASARTAAEIHRLVDELARREQADVSSWVDAPCELLLTVQAARGARAVRVPAQDIRRDRIFREFHCVRCAYGWSSDRCR